MLKFDGNPKHQPKLCYCGTPTLSSIAAELTNGTSPHELGFFDDLMLHDSKLDVAANSLDIISDAALSNLIGSSDATASSLLDRFRG
jgi:hypothetical protein